MRRQEQEQGNDDNYKNYIHNSTKKTQTGTSSKQQITANQQHHSNRNKKKSSPEGKRQAWKTRRQRQPRVAPEGNYLYMQERQPRADHKGGWETKRQPRAAQEGNHEGRRAWETRRQRHYDQKQCRLLRCHFLASFRRPPLASSFNIYNTYSFGYSF